MTIILLRTAMDGIYWFTDSPSPTALQVGGKGASLCALTKAGFTVPRGFIATINTPSAILAAFTTLNTDHVAVRSSATVEDGAHAAWAGQFSTFLHVEETSLLDRIQECFDSVTNERAVSYAAQHGIDPSTIRMAVVVQAMIDGDFSGVAFSVHPITQRRDEIVIEAVAGQGEALVSGRTTPDTMVVDKVTGTVKTVYLQSDAALLTERQRDRITTVTRDIETLYGYAVDIEWTIKSDTLYILQARPITTLAI